MTELEEVPARKSRDWKRLLTLGAVILLAAIFSFLNADERIAINIGFTVLYRLPLVGVLFTVFLLGMLTMFLFGLRHDRAVREALRAQGFRQGMPSRPLARPLPPPPAQPLRNDYDLDPTHPHTYLEDQPEPEPPA